MPVRAYNVAQKQLHTRYVFGVYASSEGLQLGHTLVAISEGHFPHDLNGFLVHPSNSSLLVLVVENDGLKDGDCPHDFQSSTKSS